MMKILFEKKLVFKMMNAERSRHERDDNGLDGFSESMAKGKVNSADEARNISKGIDELRASMAKSSILSEQDQKEYHEKLTKLEDEPDEFAFNNLKQEFAAHQRQVQQRFDRYTSKLFANEAAAFAKDDERKVRTVQEYIDWYKQLTNEGEREKALAALDYEIEERKNLRQQIVKLNPELKKDVLKMDRTEMTSKLEELREMDENKKKYLVLLKEFAHLSSSIEHQLKHFEDQTPEDQARMVKRENFMESFVKPRKEVADKYEKLPEKFKNDSEFNKLKLSDKRIFLEKLERQIFNNFMSEVNRIPEETWSLTTKAFAIKAFLEVKDLGEKANRLLMLPEFIKAEQKLTDKYKKYPDYLRGMPDYSINKWENCSFEEKQELLDKMETEKALFKTINGLLQNNLKKQVISQSTYRRYLENYQHGTMKDRAEAVNNFGTFIKPRNDLLVQFSRLDESVQDHFKAEFLRHGYEGRLIEFKKAQEFQEKNSKAKTKDEIPAQVKNEEPKAEKPTKKQEEQTESDISEIMLDDYLQKELEDLDLAGEIIDDLEDQRLKNKGEEGLTKRNARFGDKKFEGDLNKGIVKASGGKKILSKDGKVGNVVDINIARFGTDRGEVSRVRERMKEITPDQNFDEAVLTGKNGEVLRIDEAEQELEKRLSGLARKIAQRKGISTQQARELISTIL